MPRMLNYCPENLRPSACNMSDLYANYGSIEWVGNVICVKPLVRQEYKCNIFSCKCPNTCFTNERQFREFSEVQLGLSYFFSARSSPNYRTGWPMPVVLRNLPGSDECRVPSVQQRPQLSDTGLDVLQKTNHALAHCHCPCAAPPSDDQTGITLKACLRLGCCLNRRWDGWWSPSAASKHARKPNIISFAFLEVCNN